MATTNPIHTYKRLIVMLALIIPISWMLAGDFLGKDTNIIIAGVCGAGLLVFLYFYKEDSKPKQADTNFPRVIPPAPIPPDPKLDITKVIDEAHSHIRAAKRDEQEDIFSGFK